jgi:glycosyltransferase involved in cell wall biosynthesis
LNQTYQDFELIVVDDCSTDNTEEVVRGFGNSRIRYIRLNENSGSPAAPTNMGITVARGEYIAVQDSDDQWLPEKLEKQMDVFKNVSSQVGVVYSDMWRVGEDGNEEYFRSPRIMPEDGIIYEEALGYRVANIGTVTLLIRKECFDRAGLFDEKLPTYIDTELLIRMSKYYLFYHIEEPLAKYYATPGSIASNPQANISARRLILEKYCEDIRRNKKLLARHYFGIGHLLCLNGQIAQGRGYLKKAVMTYPIDVKSFLLALISLFGQRSYNKAIQGYKRIIRCC